MSAVHTAWCSFFTYFGSTIFTSFRNFERAKYLEVLIYLFEQEIWQSIRAYKVNVNGFLLPRLHCNEWLRMNSECITHCIILTAILEWALLLRACLAGIYWYFILRISNLAIRIIHIGLTLHCVFHHSMVKYSTAAIKTDCTLWFDMDLKWIHILTEKWCV